MCGRFTLRTPANLLVDHFMVGSTPDLVPRYNIAPTQTVPIVRQVPDQRTLFAMRWGLVPYWAADLRVGSRMINARAETVATKPAFRAAFERRRCVVPADGYYEWLRDGKRKQPFLIHLNDDQPFGMAGLWEKWRPKTGSDEPTVESFTIITTTANDDTEGVHDRMPVILDPRDYDRWIDPENDDKKSLQDLLRPYDKPLRVEPVNPIVNNVKNDVPECVEVQPTLF